MVFEDFLVIFNTINKVDFYEKIYANTKTNILLLFKYKHSLEKQYNSIDEYNAEYKLIYEWLMKNFNQNDIYCTSLLIHVTTHYSTGTSINSHIVTLKLHFKNKNDALRCKMTWNFIRSKHRFVKLSVKSI